MEKFTETLTNIGIWAGENKYLSAIRDAFQEYMPFTIIGAIGTLWVYVLVNADSGLGAFFSPIMALEFLNPAFNALNFCTIGCISIGIAFALGIEIGKRNGLKGYYPGLLAVAALFAVTNTNQLVDGISVTLQDGTVTTLMEALPNGQFGSISAVSSNVLGATGLFTAMIMAILSVELLTFFNKFEKIKIKMPDVVPPNIATSFNVIIPSGITLVILAIVGHLCYMGTGLYVGDLVFSLVQTPLQHVGGTYVGGLIFILVITLFWVVGLHGNNMTAGIMNPLFLALMVENENAILSGAQPTNILNAPFWACFVTICGTGVAMAITLSILIVSKREDLRSVAKLSFVPNCFNINETVVFGIPIVLNPILGIGFILAPMVCYTVGYVLTAIGFCPMMYINIPWTTPPFISGFLAAGGSINAALTQLIAISSAVLVYIPFVKMYENYLNKQDQIEVVEEEASTRLTTAEE